MTAKGGAQRYAAEAGIALVAPDTSPRGLELPGEHDDWDFGSGAGFYVNATESPFRDHYRMYAYVTEELPALLSQTQPIDVARASITGHSMGGHGALVIGPAALDLDPHLKEDLGVEQLFHLEAGFGADPLEALAWRESRWYAIQG